MERGHELVPHRPERRPDTLTPTPTLPLTLTLTLTLPPTLTLTLPLPPAQVPHRPERGVALGAADGVLRPCLPLATHHLLPLPLLLRSTSLRTTCYSLRATCYLPRTTTRFLLRPLTTPQVQSFTSLYDQDEDSGAFVVVPRSWEAHGDLSRHVLWL